MKTQMRTLEELLNEWHDDQLMASAIREFDLFKRNLPLFMNNPVKAHVRSISRLFED